MTVSIGIYTRDNTIRVSIASRATGGEDDNTELCHRIANQIEAGVYETVRRLVTNNEIPEIRVTWDNQIIRVIHK